MRASKGIPRISDLFFRSNLVFSRTVFKSICTAALTAGLLSSCTLFERDADGEPSHSWVEGKNYYSYGDKDATLATVAYSQGDFKTAERHVARALTNNPRHPQALMVGALVYEELGRPNRARQYYEDLMLVGGDENTLLGSPDGKPRKMSEIANQRLRLLNMNQTRMIIEDKDGNKVFNISGEAAARQGKSALEEALFIREQTRAANNRAVSEADVKAVEVLFTPEEQNTVSRFLILKELAENDMVTKEEFLNGRMANLGGLLPLTNTPPAYGVVKPVPSPDLILERIKALKEAVASRAITPREFSAERDLIIEAILPPHPRQRLKNKAPSKNILDAAKDIRKLEVLYDLNLITSKEKEKEQKAIEKYLGIAPAPVKKTAASAPAGAPKSMNPAPLAPTAPEVKTEVTVQVEEPAASAPQPLIPAVSSPFENIEIK